MKKLLYVGLLFLAARGWATNGYIQSRSCTGANGTVSCAFSNNVKAGNTIIVGCEDGVNTTTIDVATDTVSDSFSGVSSTLNGPSLSLLISYALNVAGGATTVTCTFANNPSDTPQISISEYASTATAGGYQTNSSSAPTAADVEPVTSNSLTTTIANEMVFDFCDQTKSPYSNGSGTFREEYVNNQYQVTMDSTVVNAGSYASTFNSTTWGTVWLCQQAAFCPTGGCTASGNSTFAPTGCFQGQ